MAVAEECLNRPVQTFLPSKDAGRDGAFVGTWSSDGSSGGSSTIQCKFTSSPRSNLTLSALKDELRKAESLARQGLADDYIIMTNHGVTGASEIAIAAAFQAVGVGRCRVFHRDWIIDQIRTSARLRMLAPSLYGLGEFSELLDSRAYAQARLVLEEMRESLKKLVVTEVHRRAVRALNEHNVVLLLGAPAAGKSTIGGSLAIGAADFWKSPTIRITSPRQLEDRLSTNIPQFFWIDDAWGTTQYQRDGVEVWNQVFPLMQAAIRIGSRFLITSRDYIWNQAKGELKLTAFPALKKSQVVIDVQDFTLLEKAQILFNHLKLGDQPAGFRREVKAYLPGIAKSSAFTPESARRFGSAFFTERLPMWEPAFQEFFEKPETFLLETIESLSEAARAAIALVFVGGGVVRSPVPREIARVAADAFGVQSSELGPYLEALNGSILRLSRDERGSYWTYKHPTMGDAFSAYVAGSPERLDIFLAGAKPETLVREVVCSGTTLAGARVVVPESHYGMLADRIDHLHGGTLAVFLSYRSDRAFSKVLLRRRPDLWKRLDNFYAPLKDDPDVALLASLHKYGLLPEGIRCRFVEAVRVAATQQADASFLEDEEVASVLSAAESADIITSVSFEVLGDISKHICRTREGWDVDYPPEDQFLGLRESLEIFARAAVGAEAESLLETVDREIAAAVSEMEESFERPEAGDAPVAESTNETYGSPSDGARDGLSELFRDVDQ